MTNSAGSFTSAIVRNVEIPQLRKSVDIAISSLAKKSSGILNFSDQS